MSALTAGNAQACVCPCIKSEAEFCDLCSRLPELDRRVQEAEEALERIQEERRALKVEINHHHDFVHLLPPEVTSVIFRFCLPPEVDVNSYSNPNFWINYTSVLEPTFPHYFRVGSVCQRWRQILVSNPQFWNTIYLPIYQTSPLHYNDVVELFLKRSGMLPLSIHIRLTLHDDDVLNDHQRLPYHRLIELLAGTLSNCISRWSLVYFCMPSSFFSKLRACLANIHRLKGLTIVAIPERLSPGRLETQSSHCFDLGFTPEPEALVVARLRLHRYNIGFKNITNLFWNHLTPNEFLQVVHSAPLLRECSLGEMQVDPPGTAAPRGVTLSFLRKLEIRYPLQDILQYLTCPNLRDISLTIEDPTGFDAFASFVRRSGCPLNNINLEIRASNDHVEQLTDLLRSTPTLERLWLAPPPRDSFFQRLGQTADSMVENSREAFLPWLKYFEMFGSRRFCWSSIALLIPDVPLAENHHRRPLEKLDLIIDTDEQLVTADAASTVGIDGIDRIDKHTLLALEKYAASGTVIRILSLPLSLDMIEDSREYHGMDEDMTT